MNGDVSRCGLKQATKKLYDCLAKPQLPQPEIVESDLNTRDLCKSSTRVESRPDSMCGRTKVRLSFTTFLR